MPASLARNSEITCSSWSLQEGSKLYVVGNRQEKNQKKKKRYNLAKQNYDSHCLENTSVHTAKAPNQSGFTAQLADYFALFCFAFFFWPSTSLSLVLNNVSWLLPIHQPISTGLGDIASLGYILVKRIPKRRVSRLGERIINHPHIKSRISAFCWVIYYLSFTQLLLHMA